jgi:hypothetical protein
VLRLCGPHHAVGFHQPAGVFQELYEPGNHPQIALAMIDGPEIVVHGPIGLTLQLAQLGAKQVNPAPGGLRAGRVIQEGVNLAQVPRLAAAGPVEQPPRLRAAPADSVIALDPAETAPGTPHLSIVPAPGGQLQERQPGRQVVRPEIRPAVSRPLGRPRGAGF